jgi:hypothetical protein
MAQLGCVPRVLLIRPLLDVAKAICSARYDLLYEVRFFPWWFKLLCARLFETKYEVSSFEAPSAYPTAVVVAEALLVDCGASKGDISSFFQQVLGVLERLMHVFFNVRHDARSAVADVDRKQRFGSK